MGYMRARSWLVFGSPADSPFKFGNVTWARHSGCRCSCEDVAACAAAGTAPAEGTGLIAQHTCQESLDKLQQWHEVRLA